MMVNDGWITAAMADDGVVVEFLLRLRQSQPVVSPSKSQFPATPKPFSWGIRQPRSRTALTAAVAVGVLVRDDDKDVDSTRCSPTTPLSWSGGASPSPRLDGYEESSRPDPASLSHAASGFKDAAANESAAGTATKRSRRKKTFAELKEEESMLLTEKINLKKSFEVSKVYSLRDPTLKKSSTDIWATVWTDGLISLDRYKELTSLQATFREQRAKNESLKKMKMDFNLKFTETFSTSSNKMLTEESSSTLTHQKESSNIEMTIPPTTLPFTKGSGSFEAQSQKKSRSTEEDCVFFLPDLNMTPSED